MCLAADGHVVEFHVYVLDEMDCDFWVEVDGKEYVDDDSISMWYDAEAEIDKDKRFVIETTEKPHGGVERLVYTAKSNDL